jgi:4a-hydroxytetrahydrobiopterin dehydratase
MQPLDKEQLEQALAETAGWQLDHEKGEIYRQYQFGNFVEALAFVNRVGEVAEQMEHHPDIIIKYNKVQLNLVTHDAGGITDKDFSLARRANELAAS